MNTPDRQILDAEPTALQRSVAAALLEIGALVVSPDAPFTWASGIVSPIYCDNRISIGYPLVRNLIRDGFNVMLDDWLGAADVVVGTATAGIPHAAWLADLRLLPMAYVRSSSKGHGKRNQIEGPLPSGSTVVIVEDLISTGGSAITAAQAIREAGSTVLGVGSIFTYSLMDADESFRAADLEYRSLTNLEALLATAASLGKISGPQVDAVLDWKRSPREWART